MAGFVYLVAVIDWYSRYVLSWEISVNMESEFCISALESALRCYGQPEIFNTDQGSQFTCKAFTDTLKDANVHVQVSRYAAVPPPLSFCQQNCYNPFFLHK